MVIFLYLAKVQPGEAVSWVWTALLAVPDLVTPPSEMVMSLVVNENVVVSPSVRLETVARTR